MIRLEPVAVEHLPLLRALMASDSEWRSRERCGYVRDGVLRSLYVGEGLREDPEVWSRLPCDPPAGG